MFKIGKLSCDKFVRSEELYDFYKFCKKKYLEKEKELPMIKDGKERIDFSILHTFIQLRIR